MQNAIILHGKPSKEKFYDPNFSSTSNYYWLPWLQKQLVIRDVPTATPEVPNNWIADYPTWLKEFERYEITPETILVGHSCGGGFILRWLSEHPDITVSKVVLAAPWLNPHNREHSSDFFDFELDKNLAKRTELKVIYSDDDEDSVLETVAILRDAFPDVSFTELHGYAHFYDSRRMEFPELLEEVVGSSSGRP
jgi:predicted alpha/beta hydrolase family esterase